MNSKSFNLVDELGRRFPGHARFLRDVGTLSGASVASAGLAVVQGLVIARWLGPAGYGTLALVLAYPGFIFGLLSARSSTVWVRYLGKFRQESGFRQAVATVKLALLVDLGIALATVGIVWISSAVAVGLLFDRSGVGWLLTLYSLTFVPRAVRSTAGAVCTVERAFDRIAAADLVGAVLRFSCVVGALYLGWGLPGVVVSYVIGDIISATFLAIVAARVLRQRWVPFRSPTGLPRDRETLRGIVHFLVITDLTELANVAVKRLDLLILAYFVPSDSVGQYKLAKSVVGALGLPIPALQSVVYQRMVELQDRPLHLEALARRIARTISIPAGVVVLSAIVWLPPLIPWLAGPGYQAAVPLGRLWVLAFATWFGLLWLRPLLYATHGERQWLAATALGSAIFLGSSVPLTMRAGVVGLTLARISFPIVVHLAGWMLSRRLVRLRLRDGWTTKVGNSVRVLERDGRRVKRLQLSSAHHVDFVVSVLSDDELATHFPSVERSSGRTLDLAWIPGRTARGYRAGALRPGDLAGRGNATLRGRSLAAAIAAIQARIHSRQSPVAEPGFDYLEFLERRALGPARGSQQEHAFVSSMVETVTAGRRGRDRRLSHPDVAPDNIVENGGAIVIVDVENLSAHELYLIDLFNTCYRFSLEGGRLDEYLRAYGEAGGSLTRLAEQWRPLMAAWWLRCIGAGPELLHERDVWRRSLENDESFWTEPVMGFEPEMLRVVSS